MGIYSPIHWPYITICMAMDGQDTIFLSYKIAQFIGNAVGFCVTSHFCDVTSTAAAAAAA